MALSAGEVYSGGEVRDSDGRMVVALDPSSSGVAQPAIQRSGALAETIPRAQVTLGTIAAPTSGLQEFVAINLRAGLVVTSITFMSGTTALVTGTHQWFSLYTGVAAPVLLGLTSDNTSTAWGANTERTLAITGGPLTIPTTGVYYLGKMIAAATVPTMAGAQSLQTTNALAPILAGTDGTNTGLTTPATAPNPAAALTATNHNLYAYVS